MTTPQLLASGLTTSLRVIELFVRDLTPAEYLHRPVAQANCAAWVLGHLILVHRLAVQAVDPCVGLPALPEGFEARFSKESPAPEAAEFGDTSVLMPLLRQHVDILTEAVLKLNEPDLRRPLANPTPMFGKLGEMLAFMPIHTGIHTGQITVARRSLGRPPIV